MTDIHNYRRRLEREEELIKHSPKIPEVNKLTILKFKRDLLAEGVGIARIARYLQTLRIVCEKWENKPFNEWTEEDVKDVLVEIETADYTPQTVNEFKKGLRRFFKWLKDEDWIGLKVLKGEKKDNRKPEVLEEEEVLKMVESAKNPRDKAMISLLYEAGLRVGELATLKWKDVTWTDFGARVKVSGKTGERVIPIVTSVPYLQRWMEYHPSYDPESGIDPEAHVFVNIGNRNLGDPMSYRMIDKVIKRAAKAAGVRKRVRTHTMRHSRATALAKHFSEAQMSQFFGWVQGSDMPRIYVHISGRDLEPAIKRLYGLEEDEAERKTVVPRRCPRCKHINAPTDRFCGRCGLLLDEEERLKTQFLEAKVLPEMIEEIVNSGFVDKFKKMMRVVEVLQQNPELMGQLVRELKIKGGEV